MFEEYADPDARRRTVTTLASPDQVTRFGAGALYEVGELAVHQGIHRAFVIADPGLFGSPAHRLIEARLAAARVPAVSAACVTPTPLYSDVEEGVRLLHANRCDGVITLGGGSAHDVGKGVALLGKNGGSLHEWAHGTRVAESVLPHIAVVTTAGTGAEASSYAFLLEEHGHEHTILHHAVLTPKVAILDPLTHVTMPPRVTASSGLNALSDAVEAYVSRSHSPESDEQAMEAIRLIHAWLPKAYRNGADLEARTHMARAAYLAGAAFNRAGLGIVDSISLVVTSLFNVGHSEANAIVLPHLMAYDAFAVEGRMADIARAFGRDPPADKRGAAQTAVEAVADLKAEVGLTATLADRGMTWDDLYLCAHTILHHPFIKRNPRPLDEEGLTKILLDSMESRRIVVEPEPVARH